MALLSFIAELDIILVRVYVVWFWLLELAKIPHLLSNQHYRLISQLVKPDQASIMISPKIWIKVHFIVVGITLHVLAITIYRGFSEETRNKYLSKFSYFISIMHYLFISLSLLNCFHLGNLSLEFALFFNVSSLFLLHYCYMKSNFYEYRICYFFLLFSPGLFSDLFMFFYGRQSDIFIFIMLLTPLLSAIIPVYKNKSD